MFVKKTQTTKQKQTPKTKPKCIKKSKCISLTKGNVHGIFTSTSVFPVLPLHIPLELCTLFVFELKLHRHSQTKKDYLLKKCQPLKQKSKQILTYLSVHHKATETS